MNELAIVRIFHMDSPADTWMPKGWHRKAIGIIEFSVITLQSEQSRFKFISGWIREVSKYFLTPTWLKTCLQRLEILQASPSSSYMVLKDSMILTSTKVGKDHWDHHVQPPIHYHHGHWPCLQVPLLFRWATFSVSVNLFNSCEINQATRISISCTPSHTAFLHLEEQTYIMNICKCKLALNH